MEIPQRGLFCFPGGPCTCCNSAKEIYFPRDGTVVRPRFEIDWRPSCCKALFAAGKKPAVQVNSRPCGGSSLLGLSAGAFQSFTENSKVGITGKGGVDEGIQTRICKVFPPVLLKGCMCPGWCVPPPRPLW